MLMNNQHNATSMTRCPNVDVFRGFFRWIEYRRIATRRTMIINQGVRVEGLTGAQSLLEDVNHFDRPGAVARVALSWHTPAKPNRHNSAMSDQADEPS